MKKTMKTKSRENHNKTASGEGTVIRFPQKKEAVSFSSSQDSLNPEEKISPTQETSKEAIKSENLGRVKKEGLESLLDRLSRLEKTQKRMGYYLKEIESFFLG
jgi:flagellar biosynthesis/type III secretory pathway ATPase